MKNYVSLILLLIICRSGYAQKSDHHEQIESAKIGFITDRLQLTTAQAPEFWVIYREYNTERQAVRKTLRELRTRKMPDNVTDTDARKYINQILDTRQQYADIEKEYAGKFLKVIAPRQLAELYRAEQDFNAMLLKQLENRRANAGRNRP